jgi:transketolase
MRAICDREDLKLKGHVPTRTGFGEGLREIGGRDQRVVALGADITNSVGMNLFRDAFPERYFSFGIAEQNIMGAASGLALGGKIPFIATYGVFSAMRTLDQIRVSVCYNNLNVKIGGAHAGISVGPDGATHQALEDIAVMRVLPNMTVLSPCDATQARLAVIAAVEQVNGPVYIRFGREAVPDFTLSSMEFTAGKAQLFRWGTEVSLIATGHMVWEALVAADMLAAEGISASVINMHTIKPLDHQTVIDSARVTKAVVTAEEHQVTGGLGGAVAEFLARNFPVPIEMIGMPDIFGESGNPGELMDKYGLRALNISLAAKQVINRKNQK